MTAYEHHIQDIQNELQSLREKVTEISGEETRKAKLETLDVNQTKFRAGTCVCVSTCLYLSLLVSTCLL